MRAGDLAPDDADVGATDRALGAVHVGNALTAVPLCGLGAVDTLKLEKRSTGSGVALSPLVGDVLSPAHQVSHRFIRPASYNRRDRSAALHPISRCSVCPLDMFPLGLVVLLMGSQVVSMARGLFDFDIRMQSREGR